MQDSYRISSRVRQGVRYTLVLGPDLDCGAPCKSDLVWGCAAVRGHMAPGQVATCHGRGSASVAGQVASGQARAVSQSPHLLPASLAPGFPGPWIQWISWPKFGTPGAWDCTLLYINTSKCRKVQSCEEADPAKSFTQFHLMLHFPVFGCSYHLSAPVSVALVSKREIQKMSTYRELAGANQNDLFQSRSESI